MSKSAKIRHRRRWRAARSGRLDATLAAKRETRLTGQEASRTTHAAVVGLQAIRRGAEVEYRKRRVALELRRATP